MSKITDIRELSRAYYKNISKTLIAERKTTQLPDFELDQYQKAVLDTSADFLRVVAPAGAGKTQTLTAKTIQILSKKPKARILCLTFTNAAAGEFNQRAQKIGSTLTNRLQVSTVNAFGYEMLKSLNNHLQIVKAGSPYIGRVYGVIKSLMMESEVWDYKPNYRLYPDLYELMDLTKTLGFNHVSTTEQASDAYDFIESLGMDRLLQIKMNEVELGSNSIKEDFLKKWFPFWRELTKQLWLKNIISLEDQKYWALDQMTSNPTGLKWIKNKKLTHVLVDEFQDINVLDLYLIQMVLVITGASLIIVGDDDQCLYEWRGCTATFIKFIDEVFKPVLNGKNFQTIELERNYRCPRNIVEHSKKLIANNANRIIKKTVPIRKDDANIRIVPLPAAYMTMNVVDELVSYLAKKHPRHSVAIVGRKKCQLIPIQILLTKREIKFRVDTDLNIFAGEAFAKFRELLELPKIYKKNRSASENIVDLIALLDKAVRSKLSDTDREGIYQWLILNEPKTLEEAVKHFGKYPTEFRKGYVSPREVARQLPYFLESKSIVKCLLAAGVVFKGFKKDFVKSKEDIFYSEPPFSHLADLAVNYNNDFDEFLYDIDRAIERTMVNDPRGAKIELMTALRTKGREFDTVIVLDANDGIFPNKKSEEEGRIEEERRLFYVMVTRTKNNLLFFDSGRINGKKMVTSPFIKEMKLPNSAWLTNPQLDRISRVLLRELKI